MRHPLQRFALTSLALLALSACGATASAPPSAPNGVVGTSSPTTPTALNQREDVDIAALASARSSGKVQIIDVRTPGEYADGRVPGAVNVPLDRLAPQHPAIAALSKDEPVYVVCASGKRSTSASDQLASQGFKALNVQGGTGAWIANGHPVEK